MLEHLFDPSLWPFTVALCMMLMIALSEAAGMLIGVSAFSAIDQLLPDVDLDLDADADVDGGGDIGSTVLGWLCVGRVPILVLLVAFLTAFGLIGITLQAATEALFGGTLPVFIAALVALFLALPPTRWLGLGLARIMPKEETEAVSTSSFIGKVAVVTGGTARRDMPAQARLRDTHGQTHYLLVEPDDDAGALEMSSEVLIISQAAKGRYRAISNDNALLSGGSEKN